MANYWFRRISDGEKVIASSLQEITRLARREATKFAQQVQVHSGTGGRKSHRVESMARNPVAQQHIVKWFDPIQREEKWKAYSSKARADKAAAQHRAFGSKDVRVQSTGSGTYKANPSFTGEEWKVSYRTLHDRPGVVYARSKAEAQDEARLVRAAGGRVSLIAKVKGEIPGARERVAVTRFASNPRRRKGSGQQAVYVVWKNGGQTYRVKCANRGMATIKANALKRDGMAGVKVTSAP